MNASDSGQRLGLSRASLSRFGGLVGLLLALSWVASCGPKSSSTQHPCQQNSECPSFTECLPSGICGCPDDASVCGIDAGQSDAGVESPDAGIDAGDLPDASMADAGVDAGVQVELSSIEIAPDAPSLPLGARLQLAALGSFSDQSSMDLTSVVTWSSSNTNVARVSATGEIRAVAIGTTTITAADGSISSTTVLTVTAAVAASIAISPDTATVAAGNSQQLYATATMTDGSSRDVTSTANWTSSDDTLATVSAAGLVQTHLQGEVTITATVGDVHSSATITVSSPALRRLVVSPDAPTAPAGTTVQLSVSGVFSDGSSRDLTSSATWSSGDESRATVVRGLVQTLTQGSVVITAKSDSISGQANVTVTPAILQAITIAPEMPTVPLGGTLQLAATGRLSDGTTRALTAVTWTSGSSSIATVSASAGVVIGKALGTTTVTASSGGITATVSVTVGPPAIQSMVLTPATPTVPLGAELQLVATATMTDQGSQIVTSQVTWNSSDSSKVSVTSTGKVKGVARGSATITATSGSVTATLLVTVGPAALATIAIQPADLSLPAGETQELSAQGTYTDGSTADISSQVTWSSSDPTIAVFPGPGSLKALRLGTVAVTATFGTVTGTTHVTVTAAAPIGLEISPQDSVIALGRPLHLVATGHLSDGSTLDETTSVTWQTSNASVAVVTSSGDVQTLSTGQVTITASIGEVFDTTTLTVTPAELVSIAIGPTNPSVAVHSTLQLSATGTYSDATTRNLTAQVVWATADDHIATITTGGLVEGKAGGNVSITAALSGISGSASLAVLGPSLISLSITPTTPSIPLGLTRNLAATGTYSDSSTQDLTNQVTWSSDSANAAVSAGGAVLASALGTANIKASFGALSATTQVTVTAAVLASINVVPSTIDLALGQQQQLVATGVLTDGTSQDLTSQATWLSAQPGVSTVSTLGLLKGVGQGSTTITATLSSISGSARVTVGPPVILSLGVTPQAPVIPAGTSVQLTARADYSDGTSSDVTAQATWTSSNAAFATASATGLVQGLTQGTVTITATVNGATAVTQVTVIDAILRTLALAPATASIPLGSPQQMTAIGTFSDGSQRDVTAATTWSSANTGIATISSSGLVQTHAQGGVTITGTSSAISATAQLTVGPPVLTAVTLSPANETIPIGTAQQMVATGTYTDGSTANLSSSATWSSTSSAVATISTTGLAQSHGKGTATITASVGSISASTTLTVGNAALVSIQILPANASLPLGVAQQFTARGTYTDGTTPDITSKAAWSSSDTSIATTSSDGYVQTLATGGITLTVSLDGVSAVTSVNVVAPVLASLVVAPATRTIALGTTFQFTATGTMTDRTTRDYTSLVTWSSSSTSIATIAAGGLARGAGQGQTTITATSGAVSATASLTVGAPDLVSIAVTPANGSMPLGRTLQMTATGTFTDGSSAVLSSGVTWSSSDMLVAVAISTGMVQSMSQGSTTISATVGLVTGSTTVSVTSPLLVSIAVSPSTASVALGNSVQLTATGTYTDASARNISSEVTWTSGNAAVVSVSGTGLVQSNLRGTASATAAVGTISGSASITVTDPVLVSLALSPTNLFLALGRTQQLTVTGTYSDHTTKDVTAQVSSWTSSNTAVLTVSGGGLITTRSKGSATVTVAIGSVSVSTSVTVGDAVLSVISVTPTGQTVPKGDTLQMVATGLYTDNTTSNISGSVAWTSSDTTLATISAAGVLTGKATGTVTFTATLGSISGSTTVTIGAARLVSIAVTPATVSIALGNTSQLAATGTYSDSTTQTLTSSVTWATSNSVVATVAAGLTTSRAMGTATITATLGSAQGSSQITVTNPELVSLAVTPNSPTVALGLSQPFTVIGTYSNASTQDLTTTATWTSSDIAIATIDSSGVAHSTGEGVASISATYQGITASRPLTVGAKALVSIAVTPANSSLPAGTTRQMTATGTYTDATTANITSSVGWSSSNTPKVTVSPAGVVTAVATGSAAVTATLGAISGSTTVTASAATLASITVTPANGNVLAGSDLQLTAMGRYTNNTTQNLTASVTWSSSSSSDATVGNTGLVHGISPGVITVTATLGSISGSTTITVGAVTLTSIAVTPASPSIALGLSQQFTATGTYSNGSTQNLTSVATWASGTPGIATISADGLAQSVSTGSSIITATLGAVSGGATLTVGAPTLVSVAVSPTTKTVPLGSTAQLTATGTYTDGSTKDLTATATWTTSSSTQATVNAGLVLGKALGNATITATSGAFSATSQITVSTAIIASISITPANPSVALGLTQQLTATALFTDGTSQNVTSQVVWSSSVTATATISASGLVTSKAQGTTTIAATSGSVSGSTTLTVGPIQLVSIAVTPASSSVPAGNQVQLTATGTFTDGSTQNLTSSATWTTTAGSVATVSTTGLVTTLIPGSATLKATQSAIVGSATVTVTQPVLASIAISPANKTISLGQSVQYAAQGTYTDGSHADITSQVAWNSGTTSVATISTAGLALSKAQGTSTITATLGSVTSSTPLTVGPAALVSIALTPANPSIPLGTNQQLVATGTYTDQTTQVITSLATWTSSDTSIATVTASGLVQSKVQGTVTITAIKDGISGTTQVTVGAPALVSIAVGPNGQSLPRGTSIQLTAVGTYTDSSTHDVSSAATWSTSASAIATVSGGLVQGVSPGTVTITATVGAIAGAAQVTISSAVLSSIAVTPASSSIALGQTKQLVATGTLTDGTTQDLSSIATWTSSITGTATVSTSGLVTSKAQGAVTITATSGGVSGSATVAITAPILVSIALTPSNQTVPLGSSLQLTATGTMSDGTTPNLTSSATWTSSNTSFATVSSGLVSSVAKGTVTITATYNGISAQTSVTVGDPALVSVALTPANQSLSLGTTLQLTATGTYTNGTTQNLTVSAGWTSSNTTVATVAGGLVTSKATGIVTITATSGAVSATTQVTVGTPQLVSISVTPAAPTLSLGQSVQLTATGTYTNGSTQNLTGSATWTSNASGIAAVVGGLVQSQAVGSATITATVNGISGNTTVTVGQATLVSLAVTPTGQTLPLGTNLQMVATGTYTDSTTKDLSSSVTWISSSNAIATISSAGVVHSVSAGTVTITAQSGAISATTNVIVGAAGLVSIAVTPATSNIPLGTGVQFVATGTYTDGSSQQINAQVTWTSSAAGVATVSSSGLAQSHATGTATITASQSGISGTAQVTVGAPVLVSITLNPPSATIPLGNGATFTATGTYTNGDTENVTGTATWLSSKTSVATVSGGVVQSVGMGTATITAQVGAVTGTASLTVNSPAVVSIAVTPSGGTLAKGLTQALTATGTFTDGTTNNITGQVTWSSNNAAVATINSGGLVQAVGQGTVTLTATAGNGVTGTAQILVVPPVLQSVSVTPPTATITLGLTRQLTATGTYSDGTTASISSQATWTSSNPTVVSVTSLGNAVSVHQGTATITATLDGISGTSAITVGPPTLVSLAIAPASKTMSLGTILQLAVTGTYTDGSNVELTSLVTWDTSSPLVAVVTSGGLVQSLSQGSTTITASLDGVSKTADITVGPPALTAITVTPGNRTIPNGTPLQLTAMGTYTNSTTVNITSSVAWTSSDTTVATISGSGLVTGMGGGTVTLTATQGSISSSVSLTVLPQTLVSISVVPANQTIPLGLTLQMTAQGTLSDGSQFDLTALSSWSSTSTSMASVNSAGLVRSISQGTVTITATDGAVSGNTTVTVAPASLVSIAVGPASPSVASGLALQLSATGTYTDGSTRDLTTLVTWTSGNTAKATVDTTGLARGVSPGTVTVTATSGMVTGTTQLTVTLPVLTSITVTPANAKFPRSQNYQMVATGTYSDGTTQDVTGSVTWSSSSASVATITTAGVARGIAVGTVTITATSTADNVSGSTTLEIKSGTLSSISITPNNVTLPLGSTLTMTATGNLSDSSTLPLSSLVTWSASPSSTCTISAAGVLQSLSQNLCTISATFGSVSATARVTIVAPTIASVSISPSSPTLPKGTVKQLTATATYTDGSTADVTSSAAWTSSTPAVVSVGASTGVASALTIGTSTLTATISGKSGTTTVTVGTAVPASLAIAPQNQTISLGNTASFTATATMSDGTSQNVTSQVTWSSSDTGIASINSSGVAQSLVQGTVTITATFGSISASTSLTVGAHALVSIALSPSNTSVPLGIDVQLTATGTYSDNLTSDLTSQANWTSSNTTNATVSAGLVRSKAQGSSTITATLGNVSGSTTVTVTQPLLVSIQVAPSTGGTIPVGRSVQLAVSGTYTDNSSSDLTSSATWTSSDTSLATVSAGLVLGKAAGTVTITGAFGGFSSQVSVIVTPAALVSIAVTPAAQGIALGLTGQVSATGTYTDGSTRNITTSVGWGSSDGTVATVSQSGLVSTLKQGTATITAVSAGATSGTATVTVSAPVLSSIAVTPASQTVPVGRSLQLTATGTYSNGATQNLTGAVTWSSSNTAFATINSAGLLQSVSAGFVTVTATLNGVSGTAPENIVAPTLVSLALSPGDTSLPKGSAQKFTATGTYTDGQSADLSAQVSWLSSDLSVASVSSVGLAQSVRVGTTRITATSGSFSAAADLTVGPAVLQAVGLKENVDTPIPVALGLTYQLTATGYYTDGTEVDLTSTAIWSAADPTIVSVSSGLVQTLKKGTTLVTATYGEFSGLAKIQVIDPVLTTISITPGNPSIPLGMTDLVLTASGIYSNGSMVDLTNQVLWSSTSPFVATVNSDGQVVTHGGGSTIVYAAYNGFAGYTELTVGPPLLESIEIQEDGTTIPLGATRTLHALGTWSDGTTTNLANAAWSSDNESVGTISSGGGFFHAAALGMVGITATLDGVSGTAAIMVGAATLASLDIVPSTVSVPLGATYQLLARGAYTDGTTADLTASSTWVSNNIGTVSVSGGLLLARAMGGVIVTATQGAFSATAQVTVVSHAPYALVLTPNGTSIPFGATQQEKATLVYTDGLTADVTASTSWFSNATSVATIGTDGLIRTVSQGQVTIQGTYSSGGVDLFATASLTVGTPTLSSLSITPSNQRLPLGSTIQMKATGTYTDGSTTDLTSVVTWVSGANIIATITSSGSLHAVAQGATSISATYGTLSATTPLTVIQAALASVAVTPANPNVPIPNLLQIFATGTYTDGTTADLTVSVTWESSDSTIAAINNSTPGVRYIQAVTQGTVTLSASARDAVTNTTITGSTVVTVGSVALTSIAITPATPTIPLGATRQLDANGTYTDGSHRKVSDATWTSSNTAIATVDSSGRVKGIARGTATITATSGSISGSTVVTVGVAVISSIELTPASVSVAAGATQQLVAKATYTDGTVAIVTSQLAWTSSTPSVATVSSSGGLVKGLSIGTATVTATDSSTGVSMTAPVTVGSRALVEIQVMTMADESLAPICGSTTFDLPLGEGITLVALGRYSDGGLADLTSQASWTSSDSSVAVVVSAGVIRTVMPGSAGSTTITASFSGISGSAVVKTF